MDTKDRATDGLCVGEGRRLMTEYDITTYCDIYKCEDCPRYGDDCDGDPDKDGDSSERL